MIFVRIDKAHWFWFSVTMKPCFHIFLFLVSCFLILLFRNIFCASFNSYFPIFTLFRISSNFFTIQKIHHNSTWNQNKKHGTLHSEWKIFFHEYFFCVLSKTRSECKTCKTWKKKKILWKNVTFCGKSFHFVGSSFWDKMQKLFKIHVQVPSISDLTQLYLV